MRYAQIRDMDISNGPGIGVSLFVQGCPLHCKGCHNPEQWNPDGGKPYTKETEDKILSLLDKPYITRLSILGGEPLSSHDKVWTIQKLVSRVPQDIEIWLYTGYTWSQLIDRTFGEAKTSAQRAEQSALHHVLYGVDYLVEGPFEIDKKDLTLAFRGSYNQKIRHKQKIDNLTFHLDVTKKFDAGEY